jgi:hypothetical protein
MSSRQLADKTAGSKPNAEEKALKRFRLRLSPSLAISVLALFVALGGTVYAASKISGKSIKPHSIPANRLKKHSITGNQVNLKKLGTVPSATSAANAVHAETAGTSEQIKTWFATASMGQTVTLLTIGPFTYTGECSESTETTGEPHALTWVGTSQANSAADSYADEAGYTTASSQQYPFNPGEKVSIGYESNEHESDGSPQWVGPYDGSDTQLSGDGHTFVNTFASVGTKVLGAACVFTGHAFTRTQ